MFVDDPEIYLAVGEVACPLPVERYWGVAVEIYWGIPTYGLDIEWSSVERYKGITTQLKDTWVRGCLKNTREAWFKDTEEYPGLI